jgi:HEPN domain-containing protein
MKTSLTSFTGHFSRGQIDAEKLVLARMWIDVHKEEKATMITLMDELLGFEDYVGRYLNALAQIPDDYPNILHPRMHLLGHAVELSLKAYILSTGIEFPYRHDLVKLLDLATEHGLSASDDERIDIKNLNQIYFKPDDEEWKFPTRYPQPGTAVWITPSREAMTDCAQGFVKQALNRVKA